MVKYISRITVLFLSLLFGAISVYAQCGSERTSVKSLSDPGAKNIDFSKAEPETIAALVCLPEQKGDAPRSASESKLVTVHAVLYAYGVEGDGDFHLCIKDESGNTMIAEIPNPKCPEASRSGHAKEYTAARAQIDKLGKATKKFKKCKQKVVITGCVFFDVHAHGQRGVAQNDIEIHPVTEVKFE